MSTRQAVDCDPIIGGGPVEPLITYADPIPDEPSTGSGGGFFGGSGLGMTPVTGGIGSGGGGSPVPAVPPSPDVPIPGPVPEPSVWLTMIAGVGALGALLRRRRAATAGGVRGTRRGMVGGALWSGSAAVEAGDVAATVAVKSTVASVASKAMMCVCPAVIAAGGMIAVPPVRQVVHAATIAPDLPGRIVVPDTVATIPCPEPMTVPISAKTLPGFPATVETVPAVISGGESSRIAAPVAWAGNSPPVVMSMQGDARQSSR